MFIPKGVVCLGGPGLPNSVTMLVTSQLLLLTTAVQACSVTQWLEWLIVMS